MNTENSKTNKPHKFRLSLSDKLNLKNPNKNITLCNLSIYYTWKNIKLAYSNNKFKISTPTWNDAFDMPDGYYSIEDIQDYFEFIIKKHETLTESPPIEIYPNQIKNKIVFKIKTGYKLLYENGYGYETMELLGSTKRDVHQDKDGEDVSKFLVVLVHCNLVNTNYQQASKVLFTFVPNKRFEQLINIVPNSLTILSTTNTEFSFIEVWFTDHNSEPLEIEDNVNLTLIIGLTL